MTLFGAEDKTKYSRCATKPRRD